MQNISKNKPDGPRLEEILPDGQIINRKWLLQKGFARSSVDYFVRSGKLTRIGHGVYRRPGPPLKWEHLLYSLQELGFALHIGSRTALDLQGYAHYLSLGNTKNVITLHGYDKLPTWINSVDSDIRFTAYLQKGFSQLPENSLSTMTFGHWDWELRLSTAELALFELLSWIKDESDFSMADKYFESTTALRPRLINELLQTCTHIQTKRLFLWFSDRHDHQWNQSIERDKIDLGKGKRVVIKGGTLDKKYNITVPKGMIHDEALFF